MVRLILACKAESLLRVAATKNHGVCVKSIVHLTQAFAEVHLIQLVPNFGTRFGKLIPATICTKVAPHSMDSNDYKMNLSSTLRSRLS